MISYYEFIRDFIFDGPDDFDRMLRGEPKEQDEEYLKLDTSPQSGFHVRVRGRYHSKLGKAK